jgi:peptidoglycan/xylan/chitin deacetylase (PgdA/CDA1 family)
MAIADATGRAPVLFRPPFGVRTPWLEPVLAALGLHCTVWTARGYDTVAVDAQRAWSRIEARLRDGAVVLLHDGIAIHRRRHPVVVLEVVELLLARSAALGLRTVTLRSAHGL